MRRTTGILLAAALTTALFASRAEAFDDRRKGFVLGFGAGLGMLNAPQFNEDQSSGLATRIEVGAGIDDRWILHYAGRQVLDLGEDGHIQLLPVAGVTHYLKDEAKSAFVTAGLGSSILAGEDLDTFLTGFAVFVGAGYEFAPHWNVEVDYANSADSAETTHTFLFTVGALAY